MTTTETTSVTVDGVEISVGGTFAGCTVVEIDPARGGDVVIVTTDDTGAEHFQCVEVDNPIVITMGSTLYGPWPTDEEGNPIDGGPEPIDYTEEIERFATVDEAAQWLAEYATEPSVYPLEGDHALSHAWWSGETFVHPHDGSREEITYRVTTGDVRAVNALVRDAVC